MKERLLWYLCGKFTDVPKYVNVCALILFFTLVSLVPADAQNITGKVTDATTGEPLPGVNVLIEGTTIGSVTNLDGEYTIGVEGPATSLSFSYVGYISQSIAVGNQTMIDVSLEMDLAEISEVVVVGYGTQKKGDITGSVAVMNTEQLAERPFRC